MLPCLTPAVSLVGLENLLHQWTTIEEEDSSSFKTLIKRGLIPFFSRRISKEGILILSKAFAMSTTPIFIVLPFFVKKLTVFLKCNYYYMGPKSTYVLLVVFIFFIFLRHFVNVLSILHFIILSCINITYEFNSPSNIVAQIFAHCILFCVSGIIFSP